MTQLSTMQSTIKAYDSGYQSLPWVKTSLESLTATVDLGAIVKLPNYKEKVQELRPLDLYRAIKKVGATDCLEVISAMSREQVTAVFDFDVWHQNVLVPKVAFGWLKVIGELGSKEVFEKFSGLDEEYQIGLLSRYITIYDTEEFEKLSDKEQDELAQFPSESLYYKVDSDDETIVEAVNDLIKALMAENMAYAMSLVAHAGYMPLNESEHTLAQFRKARIEEDGFCDYNESLGFFERVSLSKKIEKWKSSEMTRAVRASGADDNMLQAVLKSSELGALEVERIQNSLLLLANNLCSASDVETDDLASIEKILVGASGMVGVALDFLSGGSVSKAAEILKAEYPKELFRFGITLLDDMRLDVFETLKLVVGEEKTEGLKRQYSRLNNGFLLDWIDRELLDILGQKWAEVLKGLFNRFPSVARVELGGERMQFKPVSNVDDMTELAAMLHALRFVTQNVGALKVQQGNLVQAVATRFVESQLDGNKLENLTEDELSSFEASFVEGLRERFYREPGAERLSLSWGYIQNEVEEVIELLKEAQASQSDVSQFISTVN